MNENFKTYSHNKRLGLVQGYKYGAFSKGRTSNSVAINLIETNNLQNNTSRPGNHLNILSLSLSLYKYIPQKAGSLAYWVECSPNGPEDLGSIPGRVIPKTLKMVLDTSLLNTKQYKVRIKGKVKQFRDRSSALPYTSV